MNKTVGVLLTLLGASIIGYVAGAYITYYRVIDHVGLLEGGVPGWTGEEGAHKLRILFQHLFGHISAPTYLCYVGLALVVVGIVILHKK